jgi:2'-5' RNA ligase
MSNYSQQRESPSGDRAVRLFVAILFPEAIRTRLGTLIDQLRQCDADVKWVEASNLHVTLQFLGATATTLMPSIEQALDEAVRGVRPIAVDVEGTGVFPPRGAARVLWVGMRADPAALEALQERVASRLEPLGFVPERRRFSPHVTLGRVRSSRNLRVCVDRLRAHESFHAGHMVIDSFALMQSQLSQRGPTYTAVKTFELKG